MKKKYALIAAGIIIIIAALIYFNGGSYLDEYNKGIIEEAKKESDSLLQLSYERQDSLISAQWDGEDLADKYKRLWEQSEQRNNVLYRKIANREKELKVIDTVFINNARYISGSVSGFYKDTIK